MMTVRFASGLAVTYNSATYVTRNSAYADLYAKKDGAWIAQVPLDAIIEVVRPCAVEMRGQTPQQSAEALLQNDALRDVRPDELRQLKRALVGFDSRRGVWK
jgi:hypothetical protein